MKINSNTSNSIEPSSVIKLKTDTFNNLLNSNEKQEHQSLKDVLAATTSLIQDEHHHIHHHHHQLMSSKDMKHQNIDNINIDDLARVSLRFAAANKCNTNGFTHLVLPI